MADQIDDISGTGMEQIKIAMNTFYRCLDYAMRFITAHEGADAAETFKRQMIHRLKSGDINMALLEESKTFDLVIAKVEALTAPA